MQRPGYSISGKLKERQVALFILLLIPVVLSAQAEKKYLRQGNREYEKAKYAESEISYRRAMDKNKTFPDAVFNSGDALYKQKKYEDAGKQFAGNSSMYEDRTKKSDALYNLGNSLLMANKVQESIEAYKSSLKVDPGNMEAKYNLAYAQDLLKQQQQQQQQQQQNQDNKDKNKDQNKDQENKDEQDQQKQDQQKNDQQQQEQQQQKISKEDAERLLNAIANDEKEVQEKVKLEKAAKARVKTMKNW
jgi:Ca-activated chloride channel homolog